MDSPADLHEKFIQSLSHHHFSSISGEVLTKNDSSYESTLKKWTRNWRFATPTTAKPLVILTPSHDSQIQAAISCCKDHGIHMRVRSGGHDYEGLSYTSVNNDAPFVVLDLVNFRSVSVDIEESTAWVEAGASLGEVYKAIADKSATQAFPAGMCPSVGVGGHFSGGGYGMISRKYGMAADNIVDAALVDANGRVLDRRSMGEELFWAIRGGGAVSFGVVLRWKIKLLAVPQVVTVFRVNRTSEQNASSLVHRWQYIADKLDEKLLIRVSLRSFNSLQQSGKRTIQASFYSLFLGRTDELLPLMEESFPELGLVREDCQEMSWFQSTSYFTGLVRDPGETFRHTRVDSDSNVRYHKGKSDFVTEPIPEHGLKMMIDSIHEEDQGMVEVLFSPFGGRMSEVSHSETPFPHRSGTIYNIHYIVFWLRGGGKEDDRHLKWIRRLHNKMASYVSKSPRGAYLNYKDLDLGVGGTSYAQASVWGAQYFKNNFKRLVQVKTKADPDNFFRNEQSIPPLWSPDMEKECI